MNYDASNPNETNQLVPVTLSADNHLSVVVKEYLSNFLSERTREAYQADFKDFGVFITKTFGPITHPKDITKTHVISFRDYLREKYSPKGVRRNLL
jgi:hypothetical protein